MASTETNQCPTCGGSGWITGTANSAGVSGLVPCSHGTGKAPESPEAEATKCPRCSGMGKKADSVLGYPDDPCYYCGGSGEKPDIKLVRALQADFKALYKPGYTTAWKSELWVRNIELGVMRLDNLQAQIAREKARYCAEVQTALDLAKAALEHDVPESCWATGPSTGNAIEDLIACPGCRAIAAIEQTKIAEGGR